jgi:HYDIN/CFA65/VesB family protein/NHL repeat-containing protein
MNKTLVLGLLALLTPMAYADQGGFSNSGGSTLVSSGVVINSSVATPSGTLTIHCPSTTAGHCAGGSYSYVSNDGTTALSASFTSGAFTESCSGGGRGGHYSCSYSFTGYISGTLTANGGAQAISGVTHQGFGTGGAAARGTTAYNSAYTPFYFSNSGQILRSDDLNGTNLITYGMQGSDVGQFYGANGIALDSAGRIYIADTYNGRVVRIDDMNGTNWTTFGTWGSDVGQFMDLSGISIDSVGRIYVMDTGNNRLVRIDDMNGTNWTAMSGIGSGVGQFAQYVAPVAFDASGRIYVADTGNKQIVRMDDMNGTNWTTLTRSPVINSYIYSLQSPMGVAVDAAGKIYVADAEYYQPAVVRVDDMTGANWTSIYLGASSTPHSIAVDSSGMVLLGGGGAQIVDNMAGVLTSSSALTQSYGPYYVFGATPVPLPSPRPSAISFSPATLTFGNQDIGTSSNSQPLTITNFGGSPLDFSGISASGDFAETSNCPNTLVAGTSCTASVSFAPTVAGPESGLLTLNDDSGNLGASQAATLAGTGTLPRHLSLSPATLNFSGYTIGDNPSQTVTVTNPSGASVGIAGIAMTGDPSFVQGNTCGSILSAGATCAVTVSFNPVAYGTFASTLIVTESSGAQETVSVSGTASPDN